MLPSYLFCSCNPSLLFTKRAHCMWMCNLHLQIRIAQTYNNDNAFSNLQLQSRPKSRRVAASLMLSCVQPCQCVSSHPVANPSAAHNRPTLTQRQHTVDSTTQIRGCFALRVQVLVCFSEIVLVLQSGAHFANFIFTKLSAAVSFWRFEMNRALATVPRAFCSQLDAQTCRNKPPATPEATHYVKSVSRPKMFSPVYSHASELLLYYSPLRWHADKTAPRRSSVTRKFWN